MTAQTAATSTVADYRSRADAGWDELTAPGGVRAGREVLADAVDRLGVDGLQAARQELARLAEDEGIRFGGEGGHHWSVDPLPLTLDSAEWRDLETGLQQRARLLDLVLRDIYGEQRLLASGEIPPEIVWGHPGFLHQACGITPPADAWLPLIATDLGRDRDGAWTVLADRTDTPSGVGYAMATRRLTTRVMAGLHRDAHPSRLRTFFAAVRAGIQQLVPRPGHTPRGVLLWSGADDEAAYEQGFLATLLGYALVEAEDLIFREGQVWLSSPEGRTLIDVIIRRVPSELADPLEFRSDSEIGVAGLLEGLRQGTVATLNPLGSGVLENPALLGLLPRLAPQLLGEELRLPSPETWWCGDPAARSHVLANLDSLVIKPIGRSRSVATAGWELDAAGRDSIRERIAHEPWAWCAQQAVQLSTAPVVGDHGLEPRRVVLRTFGALVDHAYTMLPGGLARVAHDDGFRIANGTGAHAKDVWVLDPSDSQESWIPSVDGGAVAVHGLRALAPRVASNLFWLGRYTERADGTARLLRVASDLAQDHGRRPESRGAQVLTAILTAGEKLSGFDLSSGDVTRAEAQLHLAVTHGATTGSVADSVRRLIDAAREVPDIMSADLWHVLSRLGRLIAGSGHRHDLAGVLRDFVSLTLAVSGINNESMTRDVTWAFIDAGTRIERAQRTTALIGHALGADRAVVVENQVAESLLASCESLITHRRRAAAGEGPERASLAAAHLLLAERSNPRSAAYQLERLAEDLDIIGDEPLAASARALAEDLAATDLGALFDGPRSAVADMARTRLEALRGLADEFRRRHLARSAPRRSTVAGGWTDAQRMADA